MANFKKSFEELKKWEGGYSNHIADTGGETYKGITRKNYPNMSFWSKIDLLKKEGRSSKDINYILGQNKEVEAEIEAFYKKNYWDTYNGDEIQNEAFATNLLLLTVNAGLKRGIKVGQEACSVGVDGIYGKQTREAFNKAGETEAMRFTEIEIVFYTNIVAKNPSQKVFLNGWLKRAKSI